MIIDDIVNAAPFIVLLFGAFLVLAFGLLAEWFKVKYLRETGAGLVSVLSFLSVLVINNRLVDSPSKILFLTLGGSPPLGACFEIDALGIFMAFSATLLGVFVTLYSVSGMAGETRLTEYYTLLSAIVSGFVGVAFAGDFVTLFVFWEIMGVASYVLVAFHRSGGAPVEAGFKYLVMGAVGSTLMLLGISLVYGMAGTVNFAQISKILHGVALSPWVIIVFGILVIGLGVKSAIVPLHTWLPDAYSEAPDPVSALLSGISTEIALFVLTRVLFLLFEPSTFTLPFAVLAVITMTFGNIMALRQDDLKRMLAYSSIAQIGYMLVGICTGLQYGLMGAFLHIFNHMLMKGAAFLGVGNLIKQTGTRDLTKMQGLGRMMPLTTLSIAVAVLGLGGVPGTNGFISKFVLFSAALEANLPLLAVIGVLNATLSMAFYLRIIMTLLSGKPAEGAKVEEPEILMVVVPVFMALFIIVFGLYPGPVVSFASEASKALTDGLASYIGAVLR